MMPTKMGWFESSYSCYLNTYYQANVELIVTTYGQIQIFLPLSLKKKRKQSCKAVAADPFSMLTGKGNEGGSEMMGLSCCLKTAPSQWHDSALKYSAAYSECCKQRLVALGRCFWSNVIKFLQTFRKYVYFNQCDHNRDMCMALK